MTIIAEIGHNMKRVLTEVATEAAERTDLIVRQGKVTGSNLCQTLVFSLWQNPEATLSEITQVGKSVGLDISPQGIDQRWTEKTATFLKNVLDAVVATKIKAEAIDQPGMSAFSHVYVEDSSVVELPEQFANRWRGLGGTGPQSTVKLQTRLDLKLGTLDGPHLVNGRTHDRKASSDHHDEAEAGALALHDLGYWKLAEWEKSIEQNSYRLSRMPSRTHFWVDNREWTCADWCQTMTENQFDVPILLGKTTRLPVRLIGFRSAPEIAGEKRRKLKRKCKERGKIASQARLALCEWTLIVTNVPVKMMSAKAALVWLGLRWQIELLFKLWKSVGQIDASRSENPWRKLCEFYAKLIAMTIQHWLFIPSIWRFADRSWTKAARTIQMHVIRVATAIHNLSTLEQVLLSICAVLDSGCRINRSQKQKRTFQKLELIAHLHA